MHPLLREAAKLAVNAFQGTYVAVGKAAGLIDFPVPPNSSMRKTSSRTIRHYYLSGVACYLPIVTMALHRGVRLHGPISVLDFGCGGGRQLLHFTRHFPAAHYFACDIDYTLIDFIRKNYPQVTAKVNQFYPPVPFDSSSMDAIYSVSTFSHIHPDDQLRWLAELFRVTRPGGYCFLTTEGRTALDRMRGIFPADTYDVDLERAGIIYKEYAFLAEHAARRNLTPVTNACLGIEGSYGNTVMTPDFVRRTWPASGFEVIDVVEGVIDARQDLVVLLRPN